MGQKADGFIKICLPLFVGLTVRSVVMLHSYSGQAKPPIYGDYEAQRHWMEITTNLPVESWYVNSTENDLLYWGLDYPPLTAYHSWLMGKLSAQINPNWTALSTSRGFESPDHKLFMRYTALLADVLLFFPAVLYFFHTALPQIVTSPEVPPFYSSLLTLVYPGLILIDHGHFQYNCVSLGLFMAAVCLLLTDRDVLGSVLFCLALGYKQMELYHSLPIFFYLLGKCLHSRIWEGFYRLLLLGASVILTMAVIFSPFFSSMELLTQVLRRIFPLDRGLFEDKVANFWCVSSPFIKWRSLYNQLNLVQLCSLTVFVSCLPFCIALLVSPRKSRLLLSLVVSSLIFFLFSYQVHEKSILLAAIPALGLLPTHPVSVFLFSIVSTLSLWPLLVKDGLTYAGFCTLLLYILIGRVVIFRRAEQGGKKKQSVSSWILLPSLIGFAVILISQALVAPPLAYPDLWTLAVAAFSFAHFGAFLLFWYYRLFAS